MVECNLAKVEVAGPNPVSRSIFLSNQFFFTVLQEHFLRAQERREWQGHNHNTDLQYRELKFLAVRE